MTNDERMVFEGLVVSARSSVAVAALALDGALGGANLITLDKVKDTEVTVDGVLDLLTSCLMDLERACKMI